MTVTAVRIAAAGSRFALVAVIAGFKALLSDGHIRPMTVTAGRQDAVRQTSVGLNFVTVITGLVAPDPLEVRPANAGTTASRHAVGVARAIIRLVPCRRATVVDVAVTAGPRRQFAAQPSSGVVAVVAGFAVDVPCLEVSSANVVPTGGGCAVV